MQSGQVVMPGGWKPASGRGVCTPRTEAVGGGGLKCERGEAEMRARAGEGRGEATLHRASVEGMTHT